MIFSYKVAKVRKKTLILQIMEEKQPCIALLEKHNIKPTANRILILKTLLSTSNPLSMTEIEEELDTVDKSNIFRTLSLFAEKHLVHTIEEGREGVRYEVCFSLHEDEDNDIHPHFVCERCHKTFCMKDFSIPKISTPENFSVHSINYVIKGLCSECEHK